MGGGVLLLAAPASPGVLGCGLLGRPLAPPVSKVGSGGVGWGGVAVDGLQVHISHAQAGNNTNIINKAVPVQRVP